MRETLFLLLATLAFASCQKEIPLNKTMQGNDCCKKNLALTELDSFETDYDSIIPVTPDTNSTMYRLLLSQYKKNTMTKAASTEDNSWNVSGLSQALYDLRDLPINILIKECPNGQYLTAERDWKKTWFEVKRRYYPKAAEFKKRIDTDSDLESQTFYITPIPLYGTYIIRTYFEGSGEHRMIPGVNNNNPDDIFLFASAEEAGYERSYSLKPIDGDSFYIESTTLYGCDNPDNPTQYDTWNYVLEANNSGRTHFEKYRAKPTQQFYIKPKGNFTVEKIEYLLDGTAQYEQMPDFITKWSATNNTSVAQQTTTSFSQTASNTSSFNNSLGVSVTVSAQFTCGLPKLMEGTGMGFSISSSYNHTWGKSETISDTRNYNFPVVVPPYSRIEAVASVTRYNIRVRYTAHLKDETSGRLIKINGIWEGVNCTDIMTSYTQYDLKTNKLVKTIKMNGVPDTLVQ